MTEDDSEVVVLEGRTVRVVDLLDPRQPRADHDLRHARMLDCQACDRFHMGRCRECGCFMKAKTWLANASCPLDRWKGAAGE